MCGRVAYLPDILRLLPDDFGDKLAEGRFVQVAIQVGGLRGRQGLVDLVYPRD